MIFKYDFRYTVLSQLVNCAFRSNFRKVVYINKEKIPKKVPIIFAPTHRNAVMDGLTLVYMNVKQIVFLARADIFGSKLLRWILSGVKVMPIYRIRDGKENLEKNNQVFKDCKRVLDCRGEALCLFPEAVHNPNQSLLPLQKGAARIALPTEALSNFESNIHIVPVSIYYTNKTEYLSDVYITFGEPVKVGEYKEVYEQNPNLAINNLRHDLDENLRSITVDIANTSYYNYHTYCLDLAGKDVAKKHFPKDKDGIVKAYRAIDNKLDDLYENNRPRFLEVVDDFARVFSILRLNKLSTKDDIKNPKGLFSLFFRFLMLILFSPIALCGLINMIFPIFFYRFLRKKIKDEQFIATIRTIVGLTAVPIFSAIQATVLGLLLHSWISALIYLFASPLLLLFASYWRKWWRTSVRMCKVRKFAKKHREDWEYVVSVTDFEI